MINRLNFSAVALLSFSAVMLGCTTAHGPKPVISANGPLISGKSGIVSQFLASEAASFSNPAGTTEAAAMLQDGFSLIYSSCSDFFQSAGTTQKWTIVSRDTVGGIGTLATSFLALHNASTTAVSNVAIATSVLFLGLDVYTKNFLFASENIESVRTLTMKALATHSSAVSSLGSLTYGNALVALSDHQDICAPMSIAALAREAIKKGIVVSSEDPAASLSKITDVQDQSILQSLGAILNPPGPVSASQAGALWWLLKESSSDQDKTKYIAPALTDLPSNTFPFVKQQNGTYVFKSDWPRQKVADLLDGFSQGTKAGFKASVSSFKDSTNHGSGGPGAAAIIAPSPPIFTLSSPKLNASTGHIGIGIK